MRLFKLSPIILPAPTVIADQFIKSIRYLATHTATTGLEALCGFLIGIIIGLSLGIPLALSRTVSALISPHITLSQVIPKAALAPLLVIWLGYGFAPKIVVATISSLLPLISAVVQGLSAPSKDLIELFDAFAATKREVLFKLRIPIAIPYIAASLEMAFLYALLGAITAEFVNADRGLGYVLVASQTNLNTPLLFACLVCVGMLGLTASAIARFVNKTARGKFRLV